MAKKAGHPGRELFDYLNGRVVGDARLQIEQHLSVCANCAEIADVVRELKQNQASQTAASASLQRSAQDSHPDAAGLADLFYARSSRKIDAQVAAHVAQCSACGAEIALYSQAENAAADYQILKTETGAVPPAAWEMIRDWEDSEFARPKPAGAVVDHELLAKLSAALREKREMEAGARADETVPVTVIDSGGRVRGVEMFTQTTDAEGARVLRHAEKSQEYDARPVHILLDYGDEKRVILSEPIDRDTLRVAQPVRRTEPLRSDYFIIED